MIIARKASKLGQELASRRSSGRPPSIGMVTSRGRLHDGHGAVINAAKTVSDLIVVALIPNPNDTQGNVVSADQFSDIGFLEQHEVDVLFAPHYAELFPRAPEQMFGIARPHNAGPLDVPATDLTMHLKLINAVSPDIVVWGERRFLEYFHVAQMIEDLGLPTQMQCVPTQRHADGAAVSATVDALPAIDRERAPVLYNTLRDVVHAIRSGARGFDKLEKTARLALRGAGMVVEYFAVLNADNLLPPTDNSTSFRVIGRVKLGSVSITDSLGLTL